MGWDLVGSTGSSLVVGYSRAGVDLCGHTRVREREGRSARGPAPQARLVGVAYGAARAVGGYEMGTWVGTRWARKGAYVRRAR